MHSPAERCVEFKIPCTNQYLSKAGSSHFIQEKLRDGQMKGFFICLHNQQGQESVSSPDCWALGLSLCGVASY